jgi:tryptophan synthase beta chain
MKRATNLRDDHLMVVCLSGRGDKDMQTVMNHMAAAEQDQEKLV